MTDVTTTLAHSLPPGAVEAIVRGRHGDPFAMLGMHGGGKAHLEIRVFAPQAAAISVIDAADGKAAAVLERIHPEGFFAGIVRGRSEPFRYRLAMTAGATEWIEEDPYRFPPLLGDVDIHLFAEGRHRRLYEVMGAHPRKIDGVAGVAFAVWAPNAARVSVVGDFNAWDGRRHPMRKRHGIGVWEIFVPNVPEGARYKFELLGPGGNLLPKKADPFAFATEAPPATAGAVHGLPRHPFADADWMDRRAAVNDRTAPISIYEVHLGSWRRGEGGRFLTYDELAEELIPYVRDMGFTHIELMPVSEHPFSGSWGYQPIGLYAPTRRFGDPDGFARFVDRAHLEGIGVIVDWVPAHFPSDEHGLARFDGTALYEHEDPRKGFHQDWNTLIYNMGRTEVANFLTANALFWLDHYHVDALRVDAVASMLYLDYSRKEGEWIPNEHGGNENLEAIAFLRETNTRVFADFPGATTAAEESTAWPGVSRPIDHGGLGFGFKWNMGWMHDTLSYIKEDPVHRRYHHDKITFGLHYAFSENFILPLSHDEVVHGKGSLIGRMPGDRWRKFANLRAYFAFMWTHPGKKLLFMGGEFGQEREWNHDQALDWHLLDDKDHRGVQALVADLNRLYRSRPALHARDCEADGFEWIDGGNAEASVFVWLRTDGGEAPVVVVANFTPVVREGYRIGMPAAGEWREVLNTDEDRYGGSGVCNREALRAAPEPWHGRDQSVRMTMPPLAAVVLERVA